MIDLVIIREVKNLEKNSKTLYEDSRIVEIQFILKLKKLNLKAFNKKICLKID